jgi:predicted TIM-barrel fold metal-dependent hydrolase
MYTFSPGGGLYVEAANGFMRDQFLFGSSYPFRPMKQGVEDFRKLGLNSEAYEAATFRTANRLLGLGLHKDQENISASLDAMAGTAFVP